jgi:rRNA maturation endonuclease Nob1
MVSKKQIHQPRSDKLMNIKYKRRCTRCHIYFPVLQNVPSSREYCDSCRLKMGVGKHNDGERFNPLRFI